MVETQKTGKKYSFRRCHDDNHPYRHNSDYLHLRRVWVLRSQGNRRLFLPPILRRTSHQAYR